MGDFQPIPQRAELNKSNQKEATNMDVDNLSYSGDKKPT